MPRFHEVYGSKLDDISDNAKSLRRCSQCPYTRSLCDGGGNRHQTAIKLENSPLNGYFQHELKKVVPGVCSIEHGNNAWVVCPRRLLGFVNVNSDLRPETNVSLQHHERESLLSAGLPMGVELGVWPEVYLQFKEDSADINYHFDFVIAPIQENVSVEWLLRQEEIEENEITEIWDSAKAGGYIRKEKDIRTRVPVLPKLENPFIIEVMTASTSGSNKEKRTDISSAFEDALLGEEHQCPGINKRQVWGRMATQLFAKSGLAEAWGGKTIWMVQDELLKNIEATTKLSLPRRCDEEGGTINFLRLRYKSQAGNDSDLEFESYTQHNAGIDFDGQGAASDILLPKVYPRRVELLKAVLRRKLSAVIRL